MWHQDNAGSVAEITPNFPAKGAFLSHLIYPRFNKIEPAGDGTRDFLVGRGGVHGIFNRSCDAPQSPPWMMRERLNGVGKYTGFYSCGSGIGL